MEKKEHDPCQLRNSLKQKGLAITRETLVGRLFALHDKIAAAFGADTDWGNFSQLTPPLP
jgi:hypothetical protein